MKANLDKVYKKAAADRVNKDYEKLVSDGYAFQSVMKYLTSKEYIRSRGFKKQEYGKEAVVETLKKEMEVILLRIIKDLEVKKGITEITSYKYILNSDKISDSIFNTKEIPEYYEKRLKEHLHKFAQTKIAELEESQSTKEEESIEYDESNELKLQSKTEWNEKEPTFYEVVYDYTNGFDFLTALPEVHKAKGKSTGRKMNTENGFRFINFRDDLKALQVSSSLIGERFALQRYLELNQGKLQEDERKIITGRLAALEGQLSHKQPDEGR